MSPTTPPLSRSRLWRSGLPRSAYPAVGSNRLRVTPWQGQPLVALVGPGRTTRSLAPAEIVACLRTLAERDVRAAVTPALSPPEAEPFFRAGFRLHEQLHLLARPITGPPPAVTTHLRRGWPWDRTRVLEVDNKAFEQFWQFDSFSLREARRATPTSRFQVATGPGRGIGVVGYAVTGRAGGRGYLQRLAVDPAVQGHGIGASLVNDCLTWLHRKGASMALVNTQEHNSRALALYERLGFVRQREGLLVLRWDRPA